MNIIVSVSKNYGIGKDGGLLFHIPRDMRYFREATMGKTVIMGRCTLASLPGGRPLKGRRSIVFSRDKKSAVPGVSVVSSVNELARIIGDPGSAFVIGGASIYEMLLPYCERAYITMVDVQAGADRFFPDIEAMGGWEMESASAWMEHEGLRYQFRVYRNSSPRPMAICGGGCIAGYEGP